MLDVFKYVMLDLLKIIIQISTYRLQIKILEALIVAQIPIPRACRRGTLMLTTHTKLGQKLGLCDDEILDALAMSSI